jgi:endonuclease YncB( thermonuclease family)
VSAGVRITPRTILVIAFVLAGFGFAAPPRSLAATLERVSDGDTISARSSNETKLRIRLLGLDAVESAHKTTPRLGWEVGGRGC